MASYLRPRRGRKSTAETQAIVLKKGEVFFEIGNDGTPTTGSDAVAFGKIKMGNGLSTYQNLGYFIDVDTTAVDWDNTGYSTATSTNQGGDLYGNLNAIAPTATMKSILGNVKALLYKLSTQVTTLNNDLNTVFIDPSTSAETPVKFRFEYNSSENAFGFRNEQNIFVSFKSGEDTSDSTAYPQHILSGFTAYARGEKITGEYVPLDTSDATAAAKNIETGYSAYVNGVKITGTANINHILKYSGNVATLSVARYNLAAASVGNYALFAGGKSSANPSQQDAVDAYNTSLVRSNPRLGLYTPRYNLAATSIGNYALFGGGYEYNSGQSYSSRMDAYNTSLVRSNPTTLSQARYYLAATSNGSYALFGGGYNNSYLNTVDAYNTSLSRSTATVLSDAREQLAATSNGSYALFGGGITNSITRYATVDAYSTSLSRSTPTALSVARYVLAATSIGDYALFAGGNSSSGIVNTVDAYDTSLSRSTPTALSANRQCIAATSLGTYALFGGGFESGPSVRMEVYNQYLSKSTPTDLSVARCELAAASVGNYALFGGGMGSSAYNLYDVVDAYYEE